MKASVKKNLVFNFLGRIWVAGMSFLFVPFYIYFLGIESYGIIGFFSSLMAVLSFLDFGMSQTLVRETARNSGLDADKHQLPSLVGTLEYIYWGIGVTTAVIIWCFADWLANDWLSAVGIGHEVLVVAIQIMGVVAATRWVSGPYRSALIGMQTQVWLNVFEAFFATLRGLGVVLVLDRVSDTVQAFFVFQGLVSALEVFLLRWKVWHSISNHGFVMPRFHVIQLKRIWKFAGGVAVISLLGSGISQMDKLLLPGLVSLETFGYYMVANTLGRSIAQLSFPVATAYRPLFAKLVAGEKYQELLQQYHKASQLMAVAVIPVTLVLAVFSKQVLWLWTGNVDVVNESMIIVSLIAMGTMFNGLVNISYSIQLAYGYLKLGLVVNFVSAVILVPAFYFGVKQFGVIAAGWIWLLLNVSYVLINVSVMHRKYLLNEAGTWYFKDIFPVLTGVAVVVLGVHHFIVFPDSRWGVAIVLIMVLFAAFFIACFAAHIVRQYLLNRFFILIKSNS